MKNALNNTAALDRLSLANVSIGFECDTSCIHFDVLVDGKNVGGSLEWLDEDGDLIRDDDHLSVNREVIDDVVDALGDDTDDSDVYVALRALLSAQLETRKALDENEGKRHVFALPTDDQGVHSDGETLVGLAETEEEAAALCEAAGFTVIRPNAGGDFSAYDAGDAPHIFGYEADGRGAIGITVEAQAA